MASSSREDRSAAPGSRVWVVLAREAASRRISHLSVFETHREALSCWLDLQERGSGLGWEVHLEVTRRERLQERHQAWLQEGVRRILDDEEWTRCTAECADGQRHVRP